MKIKIKKDETVKKLVCYCRKDPSKRIDLEKFLENIFIKELGISQKNLKSLLSYSLDQIIDKNYCENNLKDSYEDENLIYIAKCLPAPKSESERFYMSGDSHFFHKMGKNQYLLGKMDGESHGVDAGLIVLTAKYYLDELMSEGEESPCDIAEKLNCKFDKVFGNAKFTTLFISLMKENKIILTDTGSGGTLIYCPIKKKLEKINPTGGSFIGLIPPKGFSKKGMLRPFYQEEIEIVPNITLLSYTDGIDERINFKEEDFIRNILRDIESLPDTINNIFGYVSSFRFLGGGDDSTVIGLKIK